MNKTDCMRAVLCYKHKAEVSIIACFVKDVQFTVAQSVRCITSCQKISDIEYSDQQMLVESLFEAQSTHVFRSDCNLCIPLLCLVWPSLFERRRAYSADCISAHVGHLCFDFSPPSLPLSLPVFLRHPVTCFFHSNFRKKRFFIVTSEKKSRGN